MRSIQEVKASVGHAIVKLIGGEETFVNGIIIPQQNKLQTHEALIIDVNPKDFIDRNFNSLPADAEPIKRRTIVKAGDVVILNYISRDLIFDALDTNGEIQTYAVIPQDSIVAIYQDGIYQRKK